VTFLEEKASFFCSQLLAKAAGLSLFSATSGAVHKKQAYIIVEYLLKKQTVPTGILPAFPIGMYERMRLVCLTLS